jgi:PIN domain nuclease of toxin-antitoxin system
VRLLLDTHAVIWWFAGDERMPLRVRELIYATEDVFVSAASAWEIATKHRLGKLPGVELLANDPMGCIAREGFLPLAVTVEQGARAGRLPGPHRDPFDRMLIAQAHAEGLAVVTGDGVFAGYGVQVVW